nr:hypothetical protein [Angustibacter aerolatus]
MGFEVLDVGGRPPSAGVQPDEPVEPFSFDEPAHGARPRPARTCTRVAPAPRGADRPAPQAAAARRGGGRARRRAGRGAGARRRARAVRPARGGAREGHRGRRGDHDERLRLPRTPGGRPERAADQLRRPAGVGGGLAVRRPAAPGSAAGRRGRRQHQPDRAERQHPRGGHRPARLLLAAAAVAERAGAHRGRHGAPGRAWPPPGWGRSRR